MKFNSLEDLLVKELQDLYSSEDQVSDILQKMQSTATSPELKETLKKHLVETKEQCKRLLNALESLQAETTVPPCQGMKGLISECEDLMKCQAPAALKDAALIGAVQKIKHYEIACYGTAKAQAKLLDLEEIAEMLDASQKEEASEDKKLSKIAEGSIFTSGINKQASR